MDELESLGGSLLGSVTGLGGLGSLGGDASTTTATSGGQIEAGTNINFGSGTIDSSPTLTQTQPTTVEQPPLTNASATPVIYAAPGYTTTAAASTGLSSLFKGNTVVYIGAAILAIAAVYIISKHGK